MSEPAFYVLAALLQERRLHGYAIIAAARDLSDGHLRLTAGTLYGVLDRLSRGGLVVDDGEELVAGRVRRYYRVTDAGAAAARAEAARLRRAVRAARLSGVIA